MGVDEATPVTEDYRERDNKFTGTIHKVAQPAEVTLPAPGARPR